MPKKIIPESECRFQFSRSGGPGGQNVNKVSSRVTLLWDYKDSKILSSAEKYLLAHSPVLSGRFNKEGQIVISEQSTRAQIQNRELAREKLNDLVTRALERPKPRKRSKVSKGQKEQRMQSKKFRARRLGDRRLS